MFRRLMERLGWIQAPRASLAQWRALVAFADAARRDGLTHVLGCGMGGSSLTAEVVARAYGATSLPVLRRPDPAAVLDAEGTAPRDRTVFLCLSKAGAAGPPPRVAAIAAWVEQLVAESSGKAGRGVVPLVDDPAAERRPDTQIVSEFSEDPLDLGAEFLKWELATWELCNELDVNAFDQPDVEAAKAFAREELARRRPGAGDMGAVLTAAELARAARPGDYLAILAYLPPRPQVAAALGALRAAWAARLGIATTLGFGPRHLHSTGQLHKGGPNTGLFLVLTADDAVDLEIPEMGVTFGHLKRAPAAAPRPAANPQWGGCPHRASRRLLAAGRPARRRNPANRASPG